MKPTLTLAVLLVMGATSLAMASPGGRDLDRTEIREEMFNRLDADGDGQFSRDEIENLAASRFQDADSDGDGFLSLEEVQAAAAARMADRADRMSTRMMDRLDANDDGRLSPDEMARSDRRSERLFERADVDGDGVVTRAEFMSVERPEGRHRGHERK
ncbi:EF-hand domain-containing protein [Tropicimonas sp. S265A]|uniref:EF-hand domain-containing protein n=1 Tax=Tropicimonas sp. S265A TaxID=3415134 RepID=UPI003C7C3610